MQIWIPVKPLQHPQLHFGMPNNVGVAKLKLRQILARNLADAMAHTIGLETQPALAAKAGIAQSQVSRILRCEIGVGIDVLESLAHALGKEPFELLMDADEARRMIMERAFGRAPVPDSKVEQHFGSPPSKVVAMRRRKNR